MKTFRTPLRTALLGLSMAVMTASPALALPVPAPHVPAQVKHVSANCRAVGMKHAAQLGGELVDAFMETQGGQQVCVILVKIPARDNNHPRVDRIVVPAG